jgi:hypothetical protein
MPVIEAQRASILVSHDHRHINHERAFPRKRGVPTKPRQMRRSDLQRQLTVVSICLTVPFLRPRGSNGW